MSNFLDNIKLIASELANMSPKTQLEIVKLCKNLCLNVKDYLVELDETTLVNITTRLDDLEDEMATAEGNIQANANAIDTINDAIDLINTALNNRYTKEEVNNLLLTKVDKSQIGFIEVPATTTSALLTNDEYNEILKDIAIIKRGDYYFYKFNQNTNKPIFNNLTKYTAGATGQYIIKNQKIEISVNTTTNVKGWTYQDLGFTVYDKNKVDELLTNKQNTLVSGTNIKTINNGTILGNGNIELQAPLISGTNIKTINNQSILGSGNINISGGGSALYMHQIGAEITSIDNTSTLYIAFNIISKRNTAYTSLEQIFKDIYYDTVNEYYIFSNIPIAIMDEDTNNFEILGFFMPFGTQASDTLSIVYLTNNNGACQYNIFNTHGIENTTYNTINDDYIKEL